MQCIIMPAVCLREPCPERFELDSMVMFALAVDRPVWRVLPAF